jgi:hypothetical protein
VPKAFRKAKTELIDLLARQLELPTKISAIAAVEFLLVFCSTFDCYPGRLKRSQQFHHLCNLPLAPFGEDVETELGLIPVETSILEVKRSEKHKLSVWLTEEGVSIGRHSSYSFRMVYE